MKKNSWSYFTQVYQKSWLYICYTVPKIRRVTDVIFIFNFGLFFTLIPPNKKCKFQKNTESAWDIILHMYQKI